MYLQVLIKLLILYLCFIHVYHHHTYIHIHFTDPVFASIASEYETCQYVSNSTKHKEKCLKKTEKITGVNQSIIPGHHIQQNNYMHKANCNIILKIETGLIK
jgi:hypothetical protein